ncbi:MAG: sensor histidine kinase [Thermodesulfobacteriota bacterium]
MMTENPPTQFAPAGKSTQETIERQKAVIHDYLGPLSSLYDAVVSEIILIVNQNRQIVFFNSLFPSLVDARDPQRLYGMRPGEAFACVNSCKTYGGCGTTEFCSKCGGVKTMLTALNNQSDIRECRILRHNHPEAIELLVRSTPLVIGEELFSIVAITDISHEKRRRALEQIFFHDVMNTAESINMFARILDSDPGGNEADYKKNLIAGISQLIEQLRSQKSLMDAENNELVIKSQRFDGYGLIREVADCLGNRFPEHRICLDGPDEAVTLKTDRELLRRVLENMLLNALEASTPDQAVTATCGIKGGYAEFRVHNEAHIPEENRLQVFQRSFSTKGPGRGLGTYSMKLLTERYLSGSIFLHTSPDHGTTFVVCCPL